MSPLWRRGKIVFFERERTRGAKIKSWFRLRSSYVRGVMSLKLSRWLHQRGFSRRKLRGTLLHRHLGDGVLARELWSLQSEPVARAWLIGVPITIIPFLPFQTFIAIPLAIVFRANVPITFAIQWMSNPFTAIVHLPACYYFGCLVLRQVPSQAFEDLMSSLPRWSDFKQLVGEWMTQVWSYPVKATQQLFTGIFGEGSSGIWSMSVKEILIPLYFGALLQGILIAVIGYFLIKAYWPRRSEKKVIPPQNLQSSSDSETNSEK